MSDSSKHSRIGDFVTIEVQYWQNYSVGDRVQEFIAVPTRGKSSCLGFSVPNYTTREQIRIIEYGAECVQERVSKFTAFVYRAWSLWGCVTRYSTRKRKLLEKLFMPSSFFVIPGYSSV